MPPPLEQKRPLIRLALHLEKNSSTSLPRTTTHLKSICVSVPQPRRSSAALGGGARRHAQRKYLARLHRTQHIMHTRIYQGGGYDRGAPQLPLPRLSLPEGPSPPLVQAVPDPVTAPAARPNPILHPAPSGYGAAPPPAGGATRRDAQRGGGGGGGGGGSLEELIRDEQVLD